MLQTSRGAILIFLLLQMTKDSTASSSKIGISTPWTEYIRFLPIPKNLPVFWNSDELEQLEGSSLRGAVRAKLRSLAAEFERIRECTASIPWCAEYWWKDETNGLTLEDWSIVDATFRSRAMELPMLGHCMVPVLDMCNHDCDSIGHYNTDNEGNSILILDRDEELLDGSEITICYGDKKGACEMLFSYGFLEENMSSARSILLPFEIPDDDPLRFAKSSVYNEAPGFKVFENGTVKWEGPYVWLACVNEEDGLGFDLALKTDGDEELQVTWKGKTVNPEDLGQEMMRGMMWDIFNLRAYTLVNKHIQEDIERRRPHIEKSRTFFGMEEGWHTGAAIPLDSGPFSIPENTGNRPRRYTEAKSADHATEVTEANASHDHELHSIKSKEPTLLNLDVPTRLSQVRIVSNDKVEVQRDNLHGSQTILNTETDHSSDELTSGFGMQVDVDSASGLENEVESLSHEEPSVSFSMHEIAEFKSENHTVDSKSASKVETSHPDLGSADRTAPVTSRVLRDIHRLKILEWNLLIKANDQFTMTCGFLAGSESVQRFCEGDEDFLARVAAQDKARKQPDDSDDDSGKRCLLTDDELGHPERGKRASSGEAQDGDQDISQKWTGTREFDEHEFW